MGVVIVCTALLLLGCLGVLRWRGIDIRPPGPRLEAGASVTDVARRYMWWVAVTTYVAIATGLMIVGPAGRLAMRILAFTAGPSAQGRLTEADEIVGRVTVGGTIGLFIFVGIFFGVVAAAGYVLLYRWLPTGLAGGAVYAVVLLALAATRIDPLRKDNRDFDIVGPGWLAVVIYVLMTLLTGAALASFAGRISRAMPEISARPRALLAYVPVVPLFVAGPPGLVIVLGFFVVLLVTRAAPIINALRSRRVVVAGRVGLAIVVLASSPAAVGALVDIAGRP